MKYHEYEITEDFRAASDGIDRVGVRIFIISCGGNYVHYAWNLPDAKAIVDKLRASIRAEAESWEPYIV